MGKTALEIVTKGQKSLNLLLSGVCDLKSEVCADSSRGNRKSSFTTKITTYLKSDNAIMPLCLGSGSGVSKGNQEVILGIWKEEKMHTKITWTRP